MTYLLADVGGSQARFSFLTKGKIGKIFYLNCDDFSSPLSLIDEMISKTSLKIQGIFLAAAGPVQKGFVQWTNRPTWHLSESELKKHFHIKIAQIYNDMYAQGMGLKGSKEILLMNVGTGFGSCFIRKGYCFPCEFGQTLDENNQKKETYLSGSGIVRLYHELGGDKKITSAKIIDEMRIKKDKKALKAYEKFYHLWGRTAGNITTGLMLHDGVCLWGGLAPRTKEDLKSFMNAFHQKNYPEFTKKIPVRIVKEKSLTLKGLMNLSKV